MPIVRAIAGIAAGATLGFFLLAYAERDASVLSLVLGALAYFVPGLIAGIVAGRYVVLAGFLAGLLSELSFVAPYAAVYHYSAENLLLVLVKGAGLYGVPCALSALAVAYVRNSLLPSNNSLNPDRPDGRPG